MCYKDLAAIWIREYGYENQYKKILKYEGDFDNNSGGSR